MKGLTICIILLSTISTVNSTAQYYVNNYHIRQADVMWRMRVWRQIDLRQKINHPLYFPIEKSQGYSSLFDVLISGIRSGSITAYGTGPLGNDDEMSTQLSRADIQSITHKVDSVWTPKLDGSGHDLVIVQDSITSEQIIRYEIKEDWIFDKNRSQMTVRVIGIAPIMEHFTEDGISRGYTKLFWIDIKDARSSLAAAPVFIRHNDNRALNYDDIFVKRFFDGQVIKVSNVYNRPIGSYASGVDALLEGEAAEELIL
ncbi:MAG: gliding motility protein GldN, partial [Flavobacteriales bacterium]|nr:gliding motility protein GldN [Flavobacteriales bacterium]